MCFIKMFIAMFSLGIITFFFKLMEDHYRHTVYEDIYGRGVIFFICGAIDYMKNRSEGNSVFDVKPHIRSVFFFRVIFVTLAYIFLYLAICNTSSFVYTALLLCLLYPVFKFANRYALVSKNFNFLDFICFGCSIAGLIFLFNHSERFSSNYHVLYDNDLAYIFGVLAVICWGISNFLL